MKRIALIIAVAALTAAGSFIPASAATGNGAPSGAHYNLNIIGVDNDKNVNMNNDAGHVIFVDLGGKRAEDSVTTKILLEQSAAAGEYAVLDKNGTDGEASFMLPAPGTYEVWARPLGQPGGSAKITTCAVDDTVEVCSTLDEVFVRGTAKSSFRNVTTNLTTIKITDPVLIEACGGDVVSLFDGCLEGYFWKYDNNGLRLLQIRFYEVAPTA